MSVINDARVNLSSNQLTYSFFSVAVSATLEVAVYSFTNDACLLWGTLALTIVLVINMLVCPTRLSLSLQRR